MITYEHGTSAHVLHCESSFNRHAMISYEHGVDFQHHGIKGMKWGIRRYQNYDGSYTQEGVKRYHAAEKRYEEADKHYKELKEAYKHVKKNGYLADKSGAKQLLKKAKADRKYEKKELSKAYDHVKMDKRADQGKELYRKGKTITGSEGITAKIASGGAALAAIGIYMHKNNIGHRHMTGIRNGKRFTKLSTGETLALAGAGASVLAGIKRFHDYRQNRKLRAYYAHTFYKRGKNTDKKYNQMKKYNRNNALRAVNGVDRV